jgi:hypothetical protein
MRRMTTARKPGRPPEAGERRSSTIQIRATPREAQQFAALGGVEWFRRALRRAYAQMVRKEGKPPA